MITEYLRSIYRDGGRGEIENGRRAYDCWGLVRAVRHEVFGLTLLPSYGAISADNKRELTRLTAKESAAFMVSEPAPAAIATVWRTGLCQHLGVCIELNGRLGVLDTGNGADNGPRWCTVREFKRRHPQTRFFV